MSLENDPADQYFVQPLNQGMLIFVFYFLSLFFLLKLTQRLQRMSDWSFHEIMKF